MMKMLERFVAELAGIAALATHVAFQIIGYRPDYYKWLKAAYRLEKRLDEINSEVN